MGDLYGSSLFPTSHIARSVHPSCARCLCWSGCARTMSYQGSLTGNGIPIADGEYSVRFALYSAPVGGDSLWAEIQLVTTTNGLFSVYLGSVNSFGAGVFDGSTRYLGVKIGEQPELPSRIAIVSVPYSLRSSQADSAIAVTDGAVDLSDLSTSGASPGQVAKFNGTSWEAADDLSGSGTGWNWSDSSSYGPDTVSAAAALLVPAFLNGNAIDPTLEVQNNGSGRALVAQTTGSNPMNSAIEGIAEDATSSNLGVKGQAGGNSGAKTGVSAFAGGLGVNYGISSSAIGGDNNYGSKSLARSQFANLAYHGRADSGNSNFGVLAEARHGGYNYSVWGSATGLDGSSINQGVKASATGPGFNYALYSSASGGSLNYAGFFEGNMWVDGNCSMLGNFTIHRLWENHRIFEFDTDNHRMNFYDFGSDNNYRLMELSAFTGGAIRLYYEADTSNALVTLKGGSSGGIFTLRDQSGNPTIDFLGNDGYNNNDRVVLHESSIDDIELMNEPGIGHERNTSCLTLTATTTMEDVVTITVTIPAPGYIYLDGHGFAELSGTTGNNRIRVQIDETAGGSYQDGYYTRIGLGAYVSTTFCDFDINCQRAYFKESAGSYTFRLEAQTENATATAKICYSSLTATYFPTSYATVTSVQQSDGGGTTPDAGLPSGESASSVITADLRPQELASKEARLQELRKRLSERTSETGR